MKYLLLFLITFGFCFADLDKVYETDTPAEWTYDAGKIAVSNPAILILTSNTGQVFTTDFTTSTGYTFVATQVTFTGSQVQQTIQSQTGQSFAQSYTSSAGFTYNTTYAEFSGGQVQQNDLTPSNSLSGFTYFVDEDMNNWSQDPLSGTLNNGAVVSGGFLDVTAGATASASYSGGSSNYPITTGSIRMIFKPNNTSLSGYLIDNIGTNEVYINMTANKIRITIKNDAGGVYFDNTSAALTWNVGQEYEILFTWNDTQAQCYRDGVRTNLDNTPGAGTVSTPHTGIFIGSYNGSVASVDGYFKDIVLYNTAIETGASYTPGYSVPEYKYSSSTINLPIFSYSGAGSVQAFTDFSSTVTGSPKFILNDQYISGTWQSSNGTYAQASTTSAIQSAIATLPASDTLQVDIVFDNDTSQSAVAETTIEYTGQTYIESLVTLPEFSYTTIGDIQSFDDFSASVTGNPRWIMGGSYYSGGWTTSSDTYATANSKADVLANISTLPATDTIIVDLVFGDGSSQQAASIMSLTYSGQVYPTDNPTLVFDELVNVIEIDSFDATFTATGTDNVKFVQVIDGEDYYFFNGAVWIEADGTYAQSNTALEISTNLHGLEHVVSAGANYKPKVFLHSGTGESSPTFTRLEIEYDPYVGPGNFPPVCYVYGTVIDQYGPINGATITITPLEWQPITQDSYIAYPSTASASSAASGYWTTGVIQSESFSGTGRYTITIEYGGNTFTKKNVIIPSTSTANFNDL